MEGHAHIFPPPAERFALKRWFVGQTRSEPPDVHGRKSGRAIFRLRTELNREMTSSQFHFSRENSSDRNSDSRLSSICDAVQVMQRPQVDFASQDHRRSEATISQINLSNRDVLIRGFKDVRLAVFVGDVNIVPHEYG